MRRLARPLLVAVIWLLACSSAHAAAPTASVTLTASSPRLAGNIGESVAGVSVSARLMRGSSQVAAGSATTGPDGSWSMSLSPAHGVLASDDVRLSYARGSAPSGTPLPATFDAQPFFTSAYITADGSTVSIAGGACSSFAVIVDGASHATAPDGRYCSYRASPHVTDQNHVQVQYTVTVGERSVDANVTSVADAGLLGGPGQAPSCHADLVFDEVVCDGLNAAAFALRVNGGPAIPLTDTQRSVSDFGPVYTGQAKVSPLHSGEVLTLDETSPVATTRHLATLHVGTLRIDVDAAGRVTGSCQPGEDLRGLRLTGSTVPFSGACAGDGSIADSGSLSAVDSGAPLAYQEDDLGQGTTGVDLPALSSAAPQANGSLPAAGWTAYAQLTGPPAPFPPTFPAESPAQILAAISGVSLAISPAAGGAAVLQRAATLGSDAGGAFARVDVGAMGAGRYVADWSLGDTHGDTEQVAKLFFIQPGTSGGPGGTSRPPKRISYRVRCVRKPARHGRHELVCTVSVRAPWARTVTVRIARRRIVFARGRAGTRHGVARVGLRDVRLLEPGSYRITIIASGGGARRVVARTIHLR